jgi:hypothetical protein
MGDSIKFVVKRRVGDRAEYLQRDRDFGPLTVSHHLEGLTLVFYDRSQAEDFVRKYERRYPTATRPAPLEIERLP